MSEAVNRVLAEIKFEISNGEEKIQYFKARVEKLKQEARKLKLLLENKQC